MSEPILVATGLEFSYGRWRPHQVFSDFDWSIPAGRTTLLLGPNGAGKSTLLKLLSGFDLPSAGSVTIGGDSRRRALYEQVAWMPQDIQPARGLTVEEQVAYAGWVAGLSNRTARRRSREVLEVVQLQDKRGARADRISGGQLRRVGLAQALILRAPVLLLDEPMAGLDPAQAENFRAILREVDCPGGVVVSTHQIADLVGDVDRVVVLADGRIRFDGTRDDFQHLGVEQGETVRSLAAVFADLVGGGGH